jgi:hypothetical protein
MAAAGNSGPEAQRREIQNPEPVQKPHVFQVLAWLSCADRSTRYRWNTPTAWPPRTGVRSATA